MARKTKEVIIPADDPGRDKGKTFIITEMSAWDAEAWGEQAYGAMVRAGLKPQPGILTGMAAVATYGVSAFLAAPWAEVRPLLAEMIDKCVKIKEPAIIRALTPDDVEEVPTLLRLREEAVKLHTDFSVAAGVLSAVVQAMAWMDQASSNTSISPDILERLSALEKQVSAISKRSTRRKTPG